MLWNGDLDSLLTHTVAGSPDETWATIARTLSGRTRSFISADSARHRYERLKAQEDHDLANYGTGEVKPPEQARLAAHIPEGEHVGFDIAFWDLETTSLGAWTGHLLCASVVDNQGAIERRNLFEFQQSSPVDDHGLAVWTRDTVERFDMSVTWNGFMFDYGFLNARLLYHEERPLRDQMGIDLRFKHGGGRYGLRVGSARLKNVALFYETKHQKPELGPSIWERAEHGDAEAMGILQDRCDLDCLVMRDIFARSKSVIRTIHR